MTEAKHTAWPRWHIIENSAADNLYSLYDPDGNRVGSIRAAHAAVVVAALNRDHFAAAPDLAESERKLVAEVEGLKAFENGIRAVIGNTNWNVLVQRAAEASAAIAKAEGGAA
jgi:hypothetical protein